MIWFAGNKEPVPTLYLFTETATVAMLGLSQMSHVV